MINITNMIMANMVTLVIEIEIEILFGCRNRNLIRLSKSNMTFFKNMRMIYRLFLAKNVKVFAEAVLETRLSDFFYKP